MKFWEGLLRIEGSRRSNIERFPGYTGIDNEKAIGKLDKSRRSNGFTKRFGKNLANSKIAWLKSP
jgi:hypothetical protein